MKHQKEKDPMLLPLPDPARRAAELKLLAELDDENSAVRKLLLASGRYQVLTPRYVDRADVLFSEADMRLEDLGDGNFRIMKSDEVAEVVATEGKADDSR